MVIATIAKLHLLFTS